VGKWGGVGKRAGLKYSRGGIERGGKGIRKGKGGGGGEGVRGRRWCRRGEGFDLRTERRSCSVKKSSHFKGTKFPMRVRGRLNPRCAYNANQIQFY